MLTGLGFYLVNMELQYYAGVLILLIFMVSKLTAFYSFVVFDLMS